MYRSGSGQFQSRTKTYVKRTSAGLGGAALGAAHLFGSRRGRSALRAISSFRPKVGIRRALKVTSGFRRAVRFGTRSIGRAFTRIMA